MEVDLEEVLRATPIARVKNKRYGATWKTNSSELARHTAYDDVVDR